MHPVPGDGDCCFTALAFSIHMQRCNIELKLPSVLLTHSIEKDADIACQLRLIAVDEWLKNSQQYQHFLTEKYKVEEEAPKF